MWAARTLPFIRTLYSEWYVTKELLVSQDGCAVLRGSEHKTGKAEPWLHTDQNLDLLPDPMCSIQGSLALVDCKDPYKSGSFVVLPKSHLTMTERVKQGKDKFTRRDHFYKLARDHDLYRDTDKNPVLALKLGAGDFVQWFSSTIHANLTPTEKGDTLLRLTPYICMAPVSHQQAKDENWPYLTLEEFRGARKIGAALGFTTSHWPGAIPKDNSEFRERHPSFKPIHTPQQCFKRDFTPEELALLVGAAPL